MITGHTYGLIIIGWSNVPEENENNMKYLFANNDSYWVNSLSVWINEDALSVTFNVGSVNTRIFRW